ncbi:MAG: hypothetical protein OXI87_00105 [Albidovulum sp.]|nr:hypothetical protein [Albidovulum sp.]
MSGNKRFMADNIKFHDPARWRSISRVRRHYNEGAFQHITIHAR